MGLFMGLKEMPPEVAAARNALDALDKHDAAMAIKACAHWEHVLLIAQDNLVDIGEVVSREDFNEVKEDLRDANAELSKRDAERDGDAARLQSLIAEGDRAGALALLREMFDSADLLSDAAALMCAGFRQEALL